MEYHMSFDETVIITIIDKCLIALVLVLAGYVANLSIEKYKATEEFRKTFALVRVDAYKKLWSLMDTLSPTKHSEITEAERRTLSDLLQTWYYQDGGAIFLSLKAADLFIKAKDSLLEPGVSSHDLRERFSSLRTELKIDVGVYGPDDRDVQIGVK
jgi:hypothetical protein